MERRCPQCGTTLPAGVPAWVRDVSVGQVMTQDPVAIGPEESLMRAVEVMRRHGIRRIPIVIGDALVGLLAQGDLNRAQPSILSDSQEEFDRIMEETPVSRIMINSPVTVTEEMPLVEAARLLHKTKYGALPVVRNGKLVGIVTDHDLLDQLVGLLEQAG
jgi:acetoin utilization protein AcuB